jgi:hypothetical protein
MEMWCQIKKISAEIANCPSTGGLTTAEALHGSQLAENTD